MIESDFTIVGIDEARGMDKTAVTVVIFTPKGGLHHLMAEWDEFKHEEIKRARDMLEQACGERPTQLWIGEDAAIHLLSDEAVKIISNAAAEHEARVIRPASQRTYGPSRSAKHKQRRYKHAR